MRFAPLVSRHRPLGPSPVQRSESPQSKARTGGVTASGMGFVLRSSGEGPTHEPTLDVSRPDDPLEVEADRTAESIMRMADPSPPRSLATGTQVSARVQRACAACQSGDEEEQTIQRAATAGESAPRAPSFGARVGAAQGRGGEALPTSVRSFMEPRFGSTFGDVRVHRDGEADALAKSVHARAFTLGPHLFFRQSEFAPETHAGRRLLAHELTHVVQQGASADRVYRTADDYLIRGVEPTAAASPEMIFFNLGSTTIPASENTKITTFVAGNPGVDVTLTGLSSEEGTTADNTTTAHARAQHVATALGAAGHTGTRTVTTDVTSGLGNRDYRRFRAVEIIPTGGVSSVPPTPALVPCSTQPNYPGHLTDAITEAQRLINDAIAKLPAPRTGATNTALRTFFGADDDATATSVLTRLNTASTGLLAHVTDIALTTRHQCLNNCTNIGGSNRGCPAGMLTLCPRFWSDPLDDRAGLLIHEGAHGAGAICAEDRAYAPSRLFPFLTPGLQLENSDSYKLFLRNLDGAVTPFGPATPDTLTGFNAGEPDVVRKIVAWVENYLTDTYLQLGFMYEQLVRHHDAPSTWSPGFYRNMMATLQTHFPELTAPPTVISANRDDLARVAAIHDRYRTMRDIFRHRSSGAFVPLNLTRGAPGVLSSWQAGPGLDVKIGDDFFALSGTPLAQALFLLRRLVNATGHISAAFRPRYVDFLDAFRVQHGVPEPPP